ncbi:MAG: type II secretion system F family protein [Thermoplasmatota archaeon]
MNWIKTPYGNLIVAIVAGAILSTVIVYVLGYPTWTMAILPTVAGIGTLAIRYRVDHNRKLAKIREEDWIPWTAAGVSAVIIGTLYFLLRYTEFFGPQRDNITLQMDLMLLGWLGMLLPPGIFIASETKRIRRIEARLPDFLSDLSDSQKSGMSLAAAVQNATKSDYGSMDAEVKILSDQMSWGMSFDTALRQFADRVNTSLVRRTTHLIIEASRAGGDTSAIFHRAAKDIRRQKDLEKDRHASMSTYVLVVYVVYFVFLMVLIVLDVQFLPHVLAAGEIAPSNFESLDPPLQEIDIRFLYFLASMVQAFGTGAVLGALMDGKPSFGFNHGAIMAFTAWVGFRLLLPSMLA